MIQPYHFEFPSDNLETATYRNHNKPLRNTMRFCQNYGVFLFLCGRVTKMLRSQGFVQFDVSRYPFTVTVAQVWRMDNGPPAP